jgi:predicted dehydrogenase
MQQLRIAILGQGRSGRDIHGHYLTLDPAKFAIVAVVDPLAERRERAAREYGCEVFDDYRALAGRTDLDLIVNATPSHLHVPITLDLLQRGHHVLCEKPLAKRAEDVDRLIDAARASGRVLAIFQQSRYAPYYQQVRQVIDSGALGRIAQVSISFSGFGRRWDWQTLQEFNGGSLLNTGPHPLDQALNLLGCEDMPEVTCWMDRATTFGDAEDYVKLILRSPGRPLIDVEISSCDAYPNCTYRVQGTLGGLKGTTSHVEWKHYLPAEAPEQRLTREPLFTPERTPAYCGESLAWHEGSWDMPQGGLSFFDTMCQSFYDRLHAVLTEGAPLEITPQQVRQQIAVIEACHRQNPHIYAAM